MEAYQACLASKKGYFGTKFMLEVHGVLMNSHLLAWFAKVFLVKKFSSKSFPQMCQCPAQIVNEST